MESIKTMDKQTVLISLFAAIEIGLIITCCVMFSNLVGTADTSNELTKAVVPISCTIGALIIVHTVLWYMYFQYEPMAMNLYFLISVSMCMIFSLTALAISLCQRS